MSVTVVLIAAVTTTASICLHLGYSLQKKGAQQLNNVAFGFRNLLRYLRTKRWILGFLVSLIGTALIIVALRLGPVSTVQPLLGFGLVFLVLFSKFYLKEHIRGIEYMALFLVVIGVIFLGFSTSEADIHNLYYEPLILFTFIAAVTLIVSMSLFLLTLIFSTYKMDIRYGILSGIFFAFASLLIRAMFNGMRIFPSSNFYWFIPISVASALIGFSMIQRGFNHGRAVIVIVFSDTTNQITIITGGLICFRERLPSDPLLFTLKLCAFVLIVCGSVILARFGRIRT